MVMNNTGKPHKANRETHTPRPRWYCSTWTKVTQGSQSSHSQSSNRKFYLIVGGWLALLGIAVAASLSQSGRHFAAEGEETAKMPEAFVTAATADSATADSARQADCPVKVALKKDLQHALPHTFRNAQPNVITNAAYLRSVARILNEGKHPLRVLQIGDSHVAGKTFPLSLRQTLYDYFGQAEQPDSGAGVCFNFFGRNGATSSHFLTESYMQKFAEKCPDLIVLSLGTNEAHGMGYRPEQHEVQLNNFFKRLREACPNAVVLLTTPPGDYLTTSYVNYRRTSRSKQKRRHVRYVKRPNPMSSRCADLIARYGAEHQMPVWNMFDICGGEQAAQRNWVSGHYMRPDRIHFQPQGYALQGKLLGEALAKAMSEGC